MLRILRVCTIGVFSLGLLAGFYFLPSGDVTSETNNSPLFAASLNNTTAQLEGSQPPPPGVDGKGGSGGNLITCELTCGPTCNQTTCGVTCVATCQFTCANTCSQVTCEATCVATCAATCANTCSQVTCASTCVNTCSYTCEEPITLASFGAEALSDQVLLNWSTGSESQNYSFEILRSSAPDGNFELIATIPSGGGVGTMEYSFNDQDVQVGVTYYYMIQDVSIYGYRTLHQNVVSARIIADFLLTQNYPNPFNSETVIRFTLPAASATRLDVYDMSGRLVTTLLNGTISGGTHQINWNAMDNAGQMLPSGVYVYRLASGNLTATGKMLFMK